jgi:hypothetical protein
MLKFAAAGGAEVVIEVGDLALSVPPYPLAESVTWCGEIDAQRQAAFERSAALAFPDDPPAKFHHLNAFAPRPADVFDVQAAASDTPAGIARVLAFCLPAARVVKRGGVPCPPESPAPGMVDAFIRGNPAAALSPLARALVGLPAERPRVQPPIPAAPKEDDAKAKDEASADPLPGLADTPKSTGVDMPKTGLATSPRSSPRSASRPVAALA